METATVSQTGTQGQSQLARPATKGVKLTASGKAHKAVERGLETRSQILNACFLAMWKHGYQGVRADKVIQDLGITKGALYHYFPKKHDLGYAIVDELITPQYQQMWSILVSGEGNAVERLSNMFAKLGSMLTPENVFLGCPLNNLMQEMSPLDEGFRERLSNTLKFMHRCAKTVIQDGQAEGIIRPTINADQMAWMLISTVEGGYSTAKTLGEPTAFTDITRQLIKSMLMV